MPVRHLSGEIEERVGYMSLELRRETGSAGKNLENIRA